MTIGWPPGQDGARAKAGEFAREVPECRGHCERMQIQSERANRLSFYALANRVKSYQVSYLPRTVALCDKADNILRQEQFSVKRSVP